MQCIHAMEMMLALITIGQNVCTLYKHFKEYF